MRVWQEWSTVEGIASPRLVFEFGPVRVGVWPEEGGTTLHERVELNGGPVWCEAEEGYRSFTSERWRYVVDSARLALLRAWCRAPVRTADWASIAVEEFRSRFVRGEVAS